MQASGTSVEDAAQNRGEHMWPWENPTSIAHGILDDECYDWLELCHGMRENGGGTLAVDDDIICDAKGEGTLICGALY